MKKIFASLFVLSILFSGCKKDITTEDTSIITYYVTFKLEGQTLMKIPKGESYVEPGFNATEGESDVTGSVVVDGTVDANSPGLYTINYSAENSDGYSSDVTRTVIVYDPTAPETDFSGTYSTKIVRTEADGSNPRDYSGEINITKIAQGIFYVDCLLGSTYSIFYGYGSGYAMTGYIALNADNSLSLLSSYVAGWGDGLTGFKNGKYDPTTELPYWESIYAGNDTFAVTTSK